MVCFFARDLCFSFRLRVGGFKIFSYFDLLKQKRRWRQICFFIGVSRSFEFAVQQRLRPLLLTDNGKDELRVRTGVAWMGNPLNRDASFT